MRGRHFNPDRPSPPAAGGAHAGRAILQGQLDEALFAVRAQPQEDALEGYV